MLARTFVSVVAVLGLIEVASAGQPLQVKPWVFDPDGLGIADAAWETKSGLPDAGKSDHGLFLEKAGDTFEFAAAGAAVSFEGELDELGFDYVNTGYCGAGAPRFNVYTENGTYYFFGCLYGVHTPAPDDPANWTRVRFNLAEFPAGDAFPANGAYDPDDFDHVVGIDIVFDEGPGATVLDNIDVNGTLVGKPGKAK